MPFRRLSLLIIFKGIDTKLLTGDEYVYACPSGLDMLAFIAFDKVPSGSPELERMYLNMPSIL